MIKSSGQWCLRHNQHQDAPSHPYDALCEGRHRDATPEEEAQLQAGENRCVDCGGVPRTRLEVEWEDEEGATHRTTCTSRFHAGLVEREAGAYEYLSESFVRLHTTSVPMTDQEALEYFSIVAQWFNDTAPKYITRRAMNEYEFKMMPYTYDAETGEVNPIEGAQVN